MILPYARQAAKLARPPPEFRNNAHLLLKRPRPRTLEGVYGTGRIPSPLTSASASLAGPESMTPASEANPEEHFEEERGEPVSAFLAFKALGIATAVVFGSAGLGALAVAKLLGVNDVRHSPCTMTILANDTDGGICIENEGRSGYYHAGLDGWNKKTWD